MTVEPKTQEVIGVTGEGNGTPLQYSCLENPMGGGPWQAVVHGVTKSWTGLRDFTFTFHFHALEEEMATHSSVLAWRSPGRGSLVGCRLWGRTESDMTEATQQQQQVSQSVRHYHFKCLTWILQLSSNCVKQALLLIGFMRKLKLRDLSLKHCHMLGSSRVEILNEAS